SYWAPAHSAIRGLPEAAAGRAEVVLEWPACAPLHGNRSSAAIRPDRAPFHSAKERRVDASLCRGARIGDRERAREADKTLELHGLCAAWVSDGGAWDCISRRGTKQSVPNHMARRGVQLRDPAVTSAATARTA